MRQEKATTNPTALQQIVAIKADDNLVLKALYQENYPRVEKFVLANNGSADEARDLFQEAFIACWRNIQLDRFVPENDTALAGYLYRIARNKWMDHLRSGRYLKTVPLVEEQVDQPQDEEVEPQQAAYLKAVRENFTKLGRNCQEVLTRFYFKKESMGEIAQAFDWTDATARNTKYRCLQKLKDFLKTK
ncbi:MAG: sigma-70 family RNA polymerase sigma factor [Chitinophagaceae bacterium]|nr:MAG: sigma-70 family RNA polymerase sigma factor [Chitinophagaceae bacterium]